MTIVELIGAPTTKVALKIECALDERTYEKGINVPDAEMATLNIISDDFYPEWNYTISRAGPRIRSGYCSEIPQFDLAGDLLYTNQRNSEHAQIGSHSGRLSPMRSEKERMGSRGRRAMLLQQRQRGGFSARLRDSP